MERCIGLDMGYGFIKIDDGREGHVFPSVVGEGESGMPMSLGVAQRSGSSELRITYGGKSYLLGDYAIRHSRLAHRGLSPTRAEGDDLKILFLGALSLYARETVNNFHVVTGLPPGRMHMADDLVRQLRGDHEVIRHVGPSRFGVSIRLENIEVVPQPVGSFWAEVLDDRGQIRGDHPLLNGRVGIMDIGFRTSDFATVIDGEYSPGFCKTVPLGISFGYEEIAQELSTQYGLEREQYTLDEAIIQGQVNVNGRPVDIVELRDRIFGDIATKLLVEARSMWQIQEYDHIIITGGGGRVLERYLRPELSQAQLAQDSVTANARGYFNWAYFNAQQRAAEMGHAAEQEAAPQEDYRSGSYGTGSTTYSRGGDSGGDGAAVPPARSGSEG
ncbi:MAG: ParM/StbA family protein [Halorhodospira halophila]|uniref:ParM/StbA family protein n=1 Tax=Halorhodospira TaxID=85108 RepID=UPI001EE865B0|nr:ParM/StbA family protein [Halorhodospira halophila]MCC3750099.1 ParM/StbA family protein [Halorhodospira halophila]MCG5532590.1 ParM/StbA family protein [Halorhodospira sp. 9621]MCG5546692.1 ParM/StbA family protein [Halorhodospira sp. M38]